jgi:hypothetical protein
MCGAWHVCMALQCVAQRVPLLCSAVWWQQLGSAAAMDGVSCWRKACIARVAYLCLPLQVAAPPAPWRAAELLSSRLAARLLPDETARTANRAQTTLLAQVAWRASHKHEMDGGVSSVVSTAEAGLQPRLTRSCSSVIRGSSVTFKFVGTSSSDDAEARASAAGAASCPEYKLPKMLLNDSATSIMADFCTCCTSLFELRHRAARINDLSLEVTCHHGRSSVHMRMSIHTVSRRKLLFILMSFMT